MCITLVGHKIVPNLFGLFCFTQMVLRNMWSFVNALGGRQPIFYIDVMLVNSDVVLYPVSADLYKWMTQTLRGCIERFVYLQKIKLPGKILHFHSAFMYCFGTIWLLNVEMRLMIPLFSIFVLRFVY